MNAKIDSMEETFWVGCCYSIFGIHLNLIHLWFITSREL